MAQNGLVVDGGDDKTNTVKKEPIYKGGTLPEATVTAEAPQWLKDKRTIKPDKVDWYQAINPKKWGLNDYSDYSSFNSASSKNLFK